MSVHSDAGLAGVIQQLNPSDPEFIANPYPMYRCLREKAPIFYWPAGRSWLITRHADVVDAIRDPRLSTNSFLWEHHRPRPNRPPFDVYERVHQKSLFRLGKDDHARVRKLVSPSMTPRAVERLREDIHEVTRRTLEPYLDREVVNLVEVVYYLPLRVIGKFFGIPAHMENTFRAYGLAVNEAILPVPTLEEAERVLAPVPAGVAMLRELIAQRRANPGDDLLSYLIRIEEEGNRLGEDELVALVSGLINAGSDTTAHAMYFAIYNLLRHPDQLALLRSDGSLLRNAIEEALRFDSFGKLGVPRFATDDLELLGAPIRKGQMVIPMLPGALRDPDAFPHPDVFDIRRDFTGNMSFGAGPHVCLGMHLARLEIEIVVQDLLTRFPNMELAGPPVFANHPVLRKMDSLPIRLNGSLSSKLGS